MEEPSPSSWLERHSNKVTVALVYASLFLDNVLLTAVVPIIPDFLYELEHPLVEISSYGNLTLSTNQGSLNNTTSRFYPRPIGKPRKSDVANENDEVGVLLSSKAFIQLFSNAIVAVITNRIGYNGPLIVGSVIILVSSLSMAVIADLYPDDKSRSRAMGIALGGIAAGVLAGYPFGSTLYDFVGKTAPFLILAILMAVNCCFQVAILKPQVAGMRTLSTPPFIDLVLDPYIILVIGGICVSTSAMAILEPCLPIWLMEVLAPPRWQLGTVFIPDSFGYLIGTNFFGPFALRVGRWKTALISLIMVGICSIMIPMASHVLHLLIPHFGLGLGIGITDAALMPLLATLVDTRHNGSYGSVFAFAQVAVCLAYSLGPLVGSHLVSKVGFPWVIRSIGIVNLVYSPLCIFLRRTVPEEIKVCLYTSSLVWMLYNQP